jgi:iron complex transport system permease protein
MSNPPTRRWVALLALALASLGASLHNGAIPLDLMAALHGDDDLARRILFELRAPRVLSAFACGALLAVSGALLQALLRNPLADPYILGVSGGASSGALLAMLLGLSWGWVNAFAGAGGVGALLLVLALAARAGGWDATRLLLTGVVLATGFGALTSLVLALAQNPQLPGMLFFLMGDVAQARHPWLALAALGLSLAAAWRLASPLDALTLGELKAASLGVAVTRLRLAVILIAGLATALVVTEAGSIGFVGLLAPHALRLSGFTAHRVLLPACALAGGSLLVLADLAARVLAAPLELPVGPLLAAIGVPVLLWLLMGRRA